MRVKCHKWVNLSILDRSSLRTDLGKMYPTSWTFRCVQVSVCADRVRELSLYTHTRTHAHTHKHPYTHTRRFYLESFVCTYMHACTLIHPFCSIYIHASKGGRLHSYTTSTHNRKSWCYVLLAKINECMHWYARTHGVHVLHVLHVLGHTLLMNADIRRHRCI